MIKIGSKNPLNLIGRELKDNYEDKCRMLTWTNEKFTYSASLL